jgi:dihydrofolate reductase/thymidylate synthase
MESPKKNNMKKINMIVAIDDMWGISKQGKIPWKITEDTHHFLDVTKRTCSNEKNTKKNAIIMGKNTWLSLQTNNNTGLKDRIVIVVSSTLELEYDAAVVVNSLRAAIDLCEENVNINEIFICGGSRIYKEALDTLCINDFYLTMIRKNYNCDNFFPAASFIKDVAKDCSKTFTVKDLSDDTDVEVTFCKYGLLEMNYTEFAYLPITSQNNGERVYLSLLNEIINFGALEQTRNSMTWSVFGKNLSFDLSKGFPLLTTKRVFFRGVVEELLFFLRGDTNAKHLSEKSVNIWDANTNRKFLDSVGLDHYQEGCMGSMYGFQLLHYNAEYLGMHEDYTGKGFNQIDYCLNLLKTDPFSRRIMMTTYNPGAAKQGCLYPCHGISIIFNVKKTLHNTYALSCMMTQRSADMFLGIPFNIASYALLVHILCETINNDETYTGNRYTPGTLIMSLGDAHVYESHYSECIRQILREPYAFPQLKINRKIKSITDFVYEDIELENYMCYPTIKAKMVA